MPRKKVAIERNLEAIQAPLKKDGGRRALRGKRGGLKDMPVMPLDILLEIFCNLEPRDLLNLARTTKPFREFLMSRGSTSMWKAARVNVKGLPDCPPHLSEPAYANLVFFPYCHNCLKPNVQSILWEFNKRYCPACAKTLTGGYKDICCTIRHDWSICHLNLGIFSMANANGRYAIYHYPEIDRIKSIWERLRDDVDAWNNFVAEQQERVNAVTRYASLCRLWDRKRAAIRSTELYDIRMQRLDTIVSKLRELGWGDELDRISGRGYYPLCDHAQVRPSKHLTDRAWAKIRDEIITYMQELKDARLRSERRLTIIKRLDALKSVLSAARIAPPKRTAEDEYKPKFQDIAVMPEVSELICVPNDVDVDKVALSVLTPMLPGLEERWKRERGAELRAVLGNRVQAAKGVDPLDLVIAAFQCKECKRQMHYPVVLAHECPLVPIPLLYERAETPEEDYLKCVVQVCHRVPWSVLNIELAPHVYDLGGVIAVCGMDPKATTQKDMDDANMRLVYDRSRFGGAVMSWRRAVRDGFKCGLWTLATEEDKAAVRDRETTRKAASVETHARWLNWRCAYCDVSSSAFTLERMKIHVKDKHAVEDPTEENGDLYLHPTVDVELSPIPIEVPKHPFATMVGSMAFSFVV